MASTSSQTPPCSTLISTTPTSKYDVFLSFRGIDTRYGFTSHLYSALQDQYNIRTFKDDREIECGEVISDALLKSIQESKIYIVVLSENYASSSWCLDELVEILNCSNTMQRLVIPVFYNIHPSVVRYQTGSLEEHFKRHEVRLAGEMERVVNWRLTLTQVAGLSGQHIDGNKSEANIVEEIVNQILPQINPTALDVARYPVGLISRVKDITALLSSGTKDVIKIGIYGMGGVGKTTLAKAVFNDQLGIFNGSCFLANVREISGTLKGLESLQQQLINDVLKSKKKVEVSNVSQGTKLIEARICSTKILVVIDDLDDDKEFKSLVGPFASGSVVIITTRDKEILDNIEVETKYQYKVNELGDAESETLLFKHAFGNTKPNNNLMILSKDILRLAGGLPLALEVFGSYLYMKSEVRWKSYIETLQRNPSSTIRQRLLISLNALESDDPLLKKMFLDIACFFIGMEKEKVVEILDTYYSYADDKIGILMKKSLLTINDANEFRMHDLLQDMGKEIARNNSPDEPGKHSRLWVPEEICYVLEEHKGTEAVEVMLHYFEPQDPFTINFFEPKEVSFEPKEVSIETLRRMSKLRFLCFNGINLTGNFKRTLEDLRWFYWERCPLKCLPFDFCPKKLVILELRGSQLITMWEVNMSLLQVSNAFEKLKTLNMSFSKDLTTTPDFRRLPCLENLNLEGCTSLKEFHISVGSLTSLVSLNLKYCENLRSLPETICNLRALKVLCIGRCTRLEALPVQLGNIESLTELNACGLSVSNLPDSICNMRSLEILDISFCHKIERLPDQLWKLTRLSSLDVSYAALLEKLPDIESSQISLSLTSLDLSQSKITALPSGISQLSKLQDLYITCCGHLLSIAELPPNLRFIDAYGCTSLEILNLSNLKHLKKLSISDCSALTEILGLAELTSLEQLDLRGCHSSLLARTLTKPLFQIYSGFEQQVNIGLGPEEFPDWMIQSSVDGSSQSDVDMGMILSSVYGSIQSDDEFTDDVDVSSSVNLRPNLSHNYLGMILCFESDDWIDEISYSVMTSASNIFEGADESCVVIVPRSIFRVTDADHTIKFTSDASSHWIHLLYKNEDDSTTVNVEDEGGYPSKRLKLLECDETGSLWNASIEWLD